MTPLSTLPSYSPTVTLLHSHTLLPSPCRCCRCCCCCSSSLQDLGAKSIVDARRRLDCGEQRLESRTGAAQAEGGVHDMHSFDKRSW